MKVKIIQLVKNWLPFYFNFVPDSLHPVIVFDWPKSANKRMLILSNAKTVCMTDGLPSVCRNWIPNAQRPRNRTNQSGQWNDKTDETNA